MATTKKNNQKSMMDSKSDSTKGTNSKSTGSGKSNDLKDNKKASSK